MAAAETGEAFLSTNASLSNADNGQITIEVTGSKGSQQFTFASGTSQTDMISSINSFGEQIGVQAAQATNNARIEFNSTEYGSEEFVRVKVLNANGGDNNIIFDESAAGAAANDVRDEGADATVLINGTQATTNGLTARVSSDGFDVSVTIDSGAGMNFAGESSTFNITDGGANFNLAPSVSMSSKVSLGIETVTTGNLGSGNAGFLSDLKSGGTSNVQNGDLGKAQEVIDAAIKQVSGLRGRLGAFQKNVVGSTISSLGVALENTSAAESQIRDTDFAAETAAMTRSQILSQAATQALSLANSQPQQVLSLLG